MIKALSKLIKIEVLQLDKEYRQKTYNSIILNVKTECFCPKVVRRQGFSLLSHLFNLLLKVLGSTKQEKKYRSKTKKK